MVNVEGKNDDDNVYVNRPNDEMWANLRRTVRASPIRGANILQDKYTVIHALVVHIDVVLLARLILDLMKY